MKSYRYPQIHKEEVKNQVSNACSSPVWVVHKILDAFEKQKWRIVVDYRQVNEVTVEKKYSNIPNIPDQLD